MQQVDRKTINYFAILVVSIFFIFGCVSKNEYRSTTKNFDNNITKDQLLDAAKRVFVLTGEDSFIIDSYRSEINVTKPKAVYKFYTMDMRNDNFHFKVDEDIVNTTLQATLSISRTYGIEEENRYYVDENSSTYTIFWDRVEYLLGLKKDWTQCVDPSWEDYFCDNIELVNKIATKDDLIDLNTTQKDRNTTVEYITIDTSNYTNTKPKKEKQEEYYLENDIDNSVNTDIGTFENNSTKNFVPFELNTTKEFNIQDIDLEDINLEDINSSKR